MDYNVFWIIVEILDIFEEDRQSGVGTIRKMF